MGLYNSLCKKIAVWLVLISEYIVLFVLSLVAHISDIKYNSRSVMLAL